MPPTLSAMADDALEISYAEERKPLARILDEVKRPGDFHADGSIETPMPLLKIKGAGTVSFPVRRNNAAG